MLFGKWMPCKSVAPELRSIAMNAVAPQYYNSLAPFRELFAQGNPILTYHKLGPRPWRVRLKGVYVSAKLFSTQLEELRRAGYLSRPLNTCTGPCQPRQIVITFDDGYVNVLRHALGPLAQTGFKAIQFLPANFLGKCNEWDVALGEAQETIMDAIQVRDWLAAGHEIGSHSLTHPFLTRLPLDKAREEITASKKLLEDLSGRAVEHFCYPYGDWNEPVRDLVMQAGYRTACTTEPGVNTPATHPFELRRFTARYPSRKLKNVVGWLRQLAR